MRNESNSKPKSEQRSRDAISPDVGKAGGLHFTSDELYEINDALNEVAGRMMKDGQTALEIELHSLARLWSAWQKVTAEICGTTDTPAVAKFKPLIEAAITHPKPGYQAKYRS